MAECKKCLMNDSYPNISFNEYGECSLCTKQKLHCPIGEDKLIKIFDEIKNKKFKYDALVPLSGGKDSTYILHLAVNIYKLKVIAMTYDNGFLTPIALENIDKAIKISKVDHVFYRPNLEVLKKIYRNMLLYTGDMCGACDIGTKANILKASHDFKTPLILYGTSPLEEDSFVSDNIQDIKRFKHVLKLSNDFSKKEINNFLIYPNLNIFTKTIYKKIGKFGKEIRPLFYIENHSDKEVGNIISKEFDWKNDSREYSKHLDCIAEPLTNYIRNNIYGYERRLCQFSNMIRKSEISREKAIKMYSEDNITSLPKNYKTILDFLNINEDDLEKVLQIPPLKYENCTSRTDKFCLKLVKLKKKIVKH